MNCESTSRLFWRTLTGQLSDTSSDVSSCELRVEVYHYAKKRSDRDTLDGQIQESVDSLKNQGIYDVPNLLVYC
jgi:hypothetical protein